MKGRNIPFNSWSIERIKQGKKFCTSRHTQYTDDKRVSFITDKIPWCIIKKYFWCAEGADSPEELQNVIEKIYNRKVPDNEGFYIHFGNFS